MWMDGKRQATIAFLTTPCSSLQWIWWLFPGPEVHDRRMRQATKQGIHDRSGGATLTRRNEEIWGRKVGPQREEGRKERPIPLSWCGWRLRNNYFVVHRSAPCIKLNNQRKIRRAGHIITVFSSQISSISVGCRTCSKHLHGSSIHTHRDNWII